MEPDEEQGNEDLLPVSEKYQEQADDILKDSDTSAAKVQAKNARKQEEAEDLSMTEDIIKMVMSSKK